VIARLDNPELRRDLARLTSQKRQQALHLAELEALRGEDPARSAAIPAAQQAIADLAARLDQLRELLGRLEITAPQDGVLLPPPRIERPAAGRALAGWSGTPLDSENTGGAVETGTLLAIVATPGQTEAIAIVDQASAALVAPGRPVKVATAQSLQGPLAGRVLRLAQLDAAELPPNLIAAGMIPQRRDETGAVRPLATSYQVRIELREAPATLLPGATGRVRITVRSQSLAARLRRWLAQTFRFQMP
jgi:multidrug resistance efflux pump